MHLEQKSVHPSYTPVSSVVSHKKEMNEMFESGVRRVKNDGDELQSLWFHRVVCVDNCNRLCFCFFFVVHPLLFRSLGIEISLENSSFVLSKLHVRKKKTSILSKLRFSDLVYDPELQPPMLPIGQTGEPSSRRRVGEPSQ